MKKKLLVLIPFAGLVLSGCTFQEGWDSTKTWFDEHIISPIASLFNGGKKEEKKKSSGSKDYLFNPEIVGGDEEEQDAILNVINFKPICNKSGNAVTEILPDIPPNLSEDEGDDILITTRQIASNGKFVDIEWSVDESQEYYGKIMTTDAYHKLIEVNYQHYGAPDGHITWRIAKLTCGGATCTNPEEMIYNATTRNEEYYHQDATIAEVNAVTDEELVVTARGSTHKFASTFDMVDYEDDPDKDKYSPYWPTNNPEGEKKYLYLNVKGKIIYTAPDGNWGLLADGDQCLEFYAGKGTPFVTSNFPNITKDRVLISGNMSQYNGNIQLGFITKIKESLENEGIEEPVLTYPELKEADIAAFKVEGYTCEKQAIDGFSNSLHSVTGTLVADSILDKEGNVVKNIDSLANNRFTYQLQVGEQVMTVAYDYHTDKEGQVGLFNALKTALKKGGQMTVKGTMRYNGNDDDCFITEGNKGVWNIVPFYTDHVVSK